MHKYTIKTTYKGENHKKTSEIIITGMPKDGNGEKKARWWYQVHKDINKMDLNKEKDAEGRVCWRQWCVAEAMYWLTMASVSTKILNV